MDNLDSVFNWPSKHFCGTWSCSKKTHTNPFKNIQILHKRCWERDSKFPECEHNVRANHCAAPLKTIILILIISMCEIMRGYFSAIIIFFFLKKMHEYFKRRLKNVSFKIKSVFKFQKQLCSPLRAVLLLALCSLFISSSHSLSAPLFPIF